MNYWQGFQVRRVKPIAEAWADSTGLKNKRDLIEASWKLPSFFTWFITQFINYGPVKSTGDCMVQGSTTLWLTSRYYGKSSDSPSDPKNKMAIDLVPNSVTSWLVNQGHNLTLTVHVFTFELAESLPE